MSATATTRIASALAGVGVAALLATSCAADATSDAAPAVDTTINQPTPTDTTPTAPDPTPSSVAPTTTGPLVATVERRELGQLLDQLIDDTRLPAVGATIFTADHIIETDVAGVRRTGDPTPVEISDKFSIGSNAKAMTATLVATFVDDGAIGWDTTIGDIYGETIPDMDQTWAALTLHQLLTHTAGIDDEALFSQLMNLDTDRPVTEQRRDAVTTITATALQRPPGDFAYSNIGYTIAGAIVEELTGTSWEDVIRTRVFDPLGMDSCGFFAPGTPGEVDQPWGHLDELDGLPMDPGDPDADLPAVLAPVGLIHCNMADWVRFLQSQLRGFQGSTTEFISAASLRAIQTPAQGSDYALGWLVAPGPGGAVTFYHHGSNHRFTAEVWLDPAADWGLITVTNIGETIADPPLATIDQAMFNRRNTP